MATTSVRALRLLSLLQARRHWKGSELADRLGVSLRTLRRDVDRLRELGYPVDAARGIDGGYHMAPGASLPPLVLDDEEAVAMAVGLLAAVQSPAVGTAEASARALGKVVQVLPSTLRRRVDALRTATDRSTLGPTATLDPAALTTLSQACRDGERVGFNYTAADGTRTDRHVEPYRLVVLRTAWYLVAFDATRQDWRTFRIDRITDAAPTGTRFPPRPQPYDDAADYVASRIRGLPRTHTVEARIHAPADIVRARIGRWADVEGSEDGFSRVRIATDSLDWAALALLTVGYDFDEVAPAEFVDHLRGWTGRLGRGTGDSL